MDQHATIFQNADAAIADFDFGERTTAVFDDMLGRSIPMYGELQRMIGEIAGELAHTGSGVYDLGCSTGITLASLREGARAAGKAPWLVGVDNSRPMFDKCRDRFAALDECQRPTLVEADLNTYRGIRNVSVVVLNLTLQFIRPLQREHLIELIAGDMQDDGCLILVEKVLSADTRINRDFIKFYYNMKRANGYSETEIARKREALENVLIPYRLEKNIELLTRNGFHAADTFFRCYNFASIVAVKGSAVCL